MLNGNVLIIKKVNPVAIQNLGSSTRLIIGLILKMDKKYARHIDKSRIAYRVNNSSVFE